MNNYLMLNGKKIKLTPEQVKEMEESFHLNGTKLENIPVGETFKVGDFEFIVLEHFEFNPGNCETLILLKDFWKTAKFDNNSNDYRESSIRKDLNTAFYEALAKEVGAENIVKHTVDLTADDGLTDYESCEDNISLLTCDMYRKYVCILKKYDPEKWWWLATAYSTKSNGYEYAVRVVINGGTMIYFNCSRSGGVRPFCILKSNIFVSK